MSPLKKMVSSGKTVGTPAPAAAGAEATSPGGTTASAGASAIEWERFEGVGQLVSPATLNMVRLRASLLPGVSAHASARPRPILQCLGLRAAHPAGAPRAGPTALVCGPGGGARALWLRLSAWHMCRGGPAAARHA